jgi:uncharacterized SAM-binding protein YcdF (DUF218 family)
MTFIFVLFLSLLTALAAAMRRRTLAWLGAAATLLFSVLFGCGIAPALLLGQLQHGYTAAAAPSWQGRNVIVLLGAGTMLASDDAASDSASHPLVEPSLSGYPGIIKAYALYRQCRQSGARCAVLVSGGDVYHYGRSEADAYADTLRTLGMPEADLLLERESRNTFANASRTAALLGVQSGHPDFDHLWLVTSAFHLRRSLLYFAHFGMRPAPVRAEDLTVKLALLPNATNFAFGDLALHEYGGIAEYYVYNALGLNPPPLDAALH